MEEGGSLEMGEGEETAHPLSKPFSLLARASASAPKRSGVSRGKTVSHTGLTES